MTYIDLTLKRLNRENNGSITCVLKEAIEANGLVVLLGVPGSGKTSLLKKYYEDNKDSSQVLTVKEVVKLDRTPFSTANVVLLDGLDEYRSISADKVFVMTELGCKIRQFAKNATVVISCREMDWYGEVDVASLKDAVNIEAALYTIQPLDDKQQQELATILKIDATDTFISKFSSFGFLDNPQMFVMLAQIYKEHPHESISNKTNLYLTFIKNAREKNPNYTKNKINVLETNEILKYVGYLAFYYMFADIDVIDEELLDKISDSDAGYSREKLEAILNTGLFYARRFIHRTIAEFALANFLNDNKLGGQAKPGITLSRVRSLFVKNERIPTGLRGAYAWLCSLTRKKELIAVDPYYQAIHGDNSLFDSELKKEVVLEIKNYSKTVNPYFYSFGNDKQLEGFYTSDLDDFLIQEFEDGLKLKNHYINFIISVISSAANLSKSMISFAKEIILKHEFSAHLKRDLLDLFKGEPSFLISVLEEVKDRKINDEDDYLIDSLLDILYPQEIPLEKIADYIKRYHQKEEIGGRCYYLFKTEYKNKYELVDEIHKNNFVEDRNPQLQLPRNVKAFIEDYFLETLLQYDISLTAKEIFNILKHFKSYYPEYDPLRFKSYRYELTDKLSSCEEKLQRLTDDLFNFYVDDILREKPLDRDIYCFHYFYEYKTPANQSEVLLSKINPDLDLKTNEMLFYAALHSYPNGKIDLEKMHAIAEKFGWKADLENLLNPKKKPWQIEDEKQKREHKEKKQRILEDNEKHFRGKSDSEIMNSFGDMHFISNFVYFERTKQEKNDSLRPDTFNRLKGLLKNAIFQANLIEPELLTLDSLTKTSYNAWRNIDELYYSSCCLNDWNEIEFEDNKFNRYLFINALMHTNVGGISKTNLVEQVVLKNPELARDVLKEYLKKLFHEYLPEQLELLLRYINKESDIDKLKELLRIFVSEGSTIQDELLNKFLKGFNFSIPIDDLKLLEPIAKNEKNKQIISALKAIAEDNISVFDMNMALAVYSLLSLDSESGQFTKLHSNLKVRLFDYIFNQFKTAESIEHHNGWQSPKNSCANFLSNRALNMLNLNELKMLKELRKDEDDIWNERITHMISEKGQQEIDSQHSPLNIEKIKNFIVSDAITSPEDFFADVCEKLNRLKIEIEGNRDNDKDFFYNQDKTGKNEEACRDVIFRCLKYQYEYDLALTKEKHEGNNRVDINIKYKANNSFEVQVECKCSSNQEIHTGIPEQLIKKYFSSGVKYGIYLIFYFGEKDKEIMLQKVHNSIPDAYKDNVKVICINLVK